MEDKVKNMESQELIPKPVTEYVEAFNQFSKKTAESVVGMAETVYKAKNNLIPIQFEQFCEGIRYDKNSPTIRKLEQIGKQAEVLKKHAEHLPNNWTTIYYLAQLSSETLDEMIESGKVFTAMSGGDAKQIVDMKMGKSTRSKRNTKNNKKKPDVTNSDSNVNGDDYVLMIYFDKIPSKPDALELENIIQSRINNLKLNCRLTHSASLEILLNKV